MSMKLLKVYDECYEQMFKKKDVTKWEIVSECLANGINLFPFITLSNPKILLVISLMRSGNNPFRYYDEIFQLADNMDSIYSFFRSTVRGGRMLKYTTVRRMIKQHLLIGKYDIHQYTYAFSKYVRQCDSLGEKSATITKSEYAALRIVSENYVEKLVPVIKMVFQTKNTTDMNSLISGIELSSNLMYLVVLPDDEETCVYISPVKITDDMLM